MVEVAGQQILDALEWGVRKLPEEERSKKERSHYETSFQRNPDCSFSVYLFVYSRMQ